MNINSAQKPNLFGSCLLLALLLAIPAQPPPVMADEIVLKFPTHLSAGVLKPHRGGVTARRLAQGVVTFPADTELDFKVSWDGASDLSILRSQPPGSIAYLDLINLEMDDEKFLKLKGVQGLKKISTNESELTDRAIDALDGMQSLQSLWLGSNQITGLGFARLKQPPPLESLDLSKNRLDNSSLASLSLFPKLKDLNLCAAGINNQGLVYLKQLPALTQLDLSRNSGITDDGIPALTGLRNLRYLDLTATKVTAHKMKELGKLKTLRGLRFSFSDLSKEDLVMLHEALPQCKLLYNKWNKYDLPTDVFAPLH